MNTRTNPIVVVGSINMDLVVRVPHVPGPGETLLGRDFATICGGKGANQAAAVGRLGGSAVMVGRVGDDDLGSQLLAGLRDNGVDTSYVQTTEGVASGIAMIVVADSGENAITVASGANFEVTPADVDAAEEIIRNARVCLLQLELPVETVLHTIQLCRKHNVETILDPAPVPTGNVPDELFKVDIFTPNETEAALLTGLPVESKPETVAEALRAKGCGSVVLKLGSRGAHILANNQHTPVAGYEITPVDTTAAGDAFTGALAVGRALGYELAEAVRLANGAGALACTKMGAQPSMPTMQAVQDLIGH